METVTPCGSSSVHLSASQVTQAHGGSTIYRLRDEIIPTQKPFCLDFNLAQILTLQVNISSASASQVFTLFLIFILFILFLDLKLQLTEQLLFKFIKVNAKIFTYGNNL